MKRGGVPRGKRKPVKNVGYLFWKLSGDMLGICMPVNKNTCIVRNNTPGMHIVKGFCQLGSKSPDNAMNLGRQFY